jgi:hypothetical protein
VNSHKPNGKINIPMKHILPPYNRRLLVLGLAIIAVLALAGGGYAAWSSHRASMANKAADSTELTVSGINYSPPTDQEKQDADDSKQKALDQASRGDNPSTGTREVSVTITSAQQNGDQVLVRAYVSGVTEDGGTCTATFSNGTDTVVKTSQGVQDATTTICSPLQLPRSELPAAGNWSIVVSYKSSAAMGVSNKFSLKVQ